MEPQIHGAFISYPPGLSETIDDLLLPAGEIQMEGDDGVSSSWLGDEI